jgi:hypothetical protein
VFCLVIPDVHGALPYEASDLTHGSVLRVLRGTDGHHDFFATTAGLIAIDSALPVTMEIAASPKSPSSGLNGVTPDQVQVVEPGRIVDYLAIILEATLGATQSELERPGSLLSSSHYNDTVLRCTRFATDTQVALYVHKNLAHSSPLQNGDVGHGRFQSPSCSATHAASSLRC